MCGINGYLVFSKNHNHNLEAKLTKMQKISAHRGPDSSSYKLFENAALGMNRLAIVAPRDHQVIQTNANNSKFAILNGEIVNYQEFLSVLPANYSNKSDAAVILPLLEKYGQYFINLLAGMFAMAVYDPLENSVQLWRDPMGIKPLYYYHANGVLLFSSEIKAIYAALDIKPDIEFAAIDNILRYRFNPGRNSVFPDIKKVLPGETIIFKDNTARHIKYWSLNPNSAKLNGQSSIEEFRDLFTKVIQQNSIADVKGGFFTSGGLDSSMVTSLALQSDKSVYKQPITIRFKPNSVIDEKYAKELEKYLGVKFEWVDLTDDIARQTLQDLIPFLDEPLENPIHVGTYLMSQRAKALGIKSIITGDGSDEFFLGYERHANWFNHPNPVQNYPKLHWTMKPEDATSLYNDYAKSKLKNMIDTNGNIISTFRNIDQALLFERQDRLPEYHNMRLDRMTMAHGIEAKVPFLDRRIVEYSTNIPTKVLFGKNGKEWLQKVAEPWLPKSIIKRPKVLFPSLPDQWLSGSGSKWAADILLNPSSDISEWINRGVLESYIKDHNSNEFRRGKLLWALIALELWLNNKNQVWSK